MKPEPPNKKSSNKKQPATDGPLKGWTAIARYLGIPVATAHRWASEGDAGTARRTFHGG